MSEKQFQSRAIDLLLEGPRLFGGLSKLTKLPARYTLILFCCATLALIATLAAPASSAAAAKWTLRQLPPSTVEGQEYRPILDGVSCPSESLCVAGGSAYAGNASGSLGTVVFSQAPTGALAKWHVVTLTPPSGMPTIRGLNGVSCASQNLCVAVSSVADSNEGLIVVSTEPMGGAAAWSPALIKGGFGLHGVSCPTTSFCAAVSGRGKVFISTEPISGPWQVTQLGGAPDLRGISCGTPSLCVAVGGEGQILVSTDPTGGASTWQEAGTPGGPWALQGVACASTLLCATGNLTGNVLTSTDPVGGGSSWKVTNAGASQRITGLTCPTASRCVGVDDNGDVLASTDPTGSWRFENLVPFVRGPNEIESPDNGLFSASCASVSLCALVGIEGRIFTSTEPFSAPSEPPTEPPVRLRPRTILLLESYPLSQTRHRRIRVRFLFYSPTRIRGFECRRDNRPFRRCHSPLRYWVSPGRHGLAVRAIGPTGLRGAAAIDRFGLPRFGSGGRTRHDGKAARTSGAISYRPLPDPNGLHTSSNRSNPPKGRP
ncbi:MAG: hypothetical protein WB507_10060 [Solirubrobacterales bacterium]